MAKPKKNEAVAPYIVKSPLYYNNARYEVGDPVDLAESEAAELLDLGTVEAQTPAAPAAKE